MNALKTDAQMRNKQKLDQIKVKNNATNKINVSGVSNANKSTPKPQYTTNAITDDIKRMAKEKGISDTQLKQMQKESDAEDRKVMYEKYRKAQTQKKSYGNLDMGVDEVNGTTAKIDKTKDEIKKQIKDTYNISDSDFEKEYQQYDKEQKNLENIRTKAKNEKFAKEHPFLGSLKSLASNLGSTIEGIANVTAGLQGGKLDESDFTLSNITDSLRSGARSNVNSKVGKTAYDIGMGAADMGTQAALAALTGGGSVMGLAQAGQTAARGQRQALENGTSDPKAALTGLGQGAVSYALSKGAYDKVGNVIPGSGLLSNITKGAITEGAEEATESAIGNTIDTLINRGNSSKQRAINDYMALGYSEEEATKMAKKDQAKGVLQDAAIGGLFGGALGGVNGALRRTPRSNTNEDTNFAETVTDVPNTQPNNDIQVDTQADAETPTIEAPKFDTRASFEENADITKALIDKKGLADNIISRINAYKNSSFEADSPQAIRLDEISAEIRSNLEQYSKTGDTSYYDAVQALTSEADSILAGTKTVAGRHKNTYEYDSNKVSDMLGAMSDDFDTINDNTQRAAAINDIIDTFENSSKTADDVQYLLDDIELFKEGYGDFTPNEQAIIDSLTDYANGYSSGNTNSAPTSDTTTKTSRFYDNTAKNNMSSEDYATLDKNDYVYESRTEADSMNEAANNINRDGVDARFNTLLNKRFETSVDTDEGMQVYHSKKDLANQLRASGDVEGANRLDNEANHILRKVAKEGSKSAQILQALAKWNRNTPEGSLAYAMAEIQRANDKLIGKNKASQIDKVESKLDQIFNSNKSADEKSKAITDTFKTYNLVDGEKAMQEVLKSGKSVDNVDISEVLRKSNKLLGMTNEQQTAYLNEAQKLQSMQYGTKEYKQQMARLGKMIDDMIPNTFGEYFKSFLYDNMLGSFRTIVSRNMGGNFGMQLMEQTAVKQLASGIDKAFSAFTGNESRLKGVSPEGLKSYGKGFKKGWGEAWEEVFNVWKKGAEDLRTTKTGFDDISDYVDANRHLKTDNKALKTAAKAFDKWDSTIKTVMNAGDKPFYEARYNQAKTEWEGMRKRGEAFKSLSDEEFKEYCETFAKLEGLKAVYQDDSLMAQAFQQMKNSIGKFSEASVGYDVASQFVLPMVQVPGNVADRIVQYSPLGFVRTGAETLRAKMANGEGRSPIERLRTGKIDNEAQSNLSTMLARNIIGTGLAGAGYGLAQSGLISGSYDDDSKVAEAQRENGEREFALKLGDKYMDIDWLTGLGTGLQTGATIYDSYNKDKDVENALLTGVSGAFDNSMTQGLNRLVGGDNNYSYNTANNLLTNTADTIKSGSSQLIPAWLRQTAAFGDDYRRELGEYQSNDYYLNSLKNGIPFLRQTLEKKVGTDGEYLRQNPGLDQTEKALVNYVLPGIVSADQNRADIDEAQRIYDATGNKGAYIPNYSRSNIKNDYLGKDKISNSEFVAIKRELGLRNKEMFDAITNSEKYKSLDDEGKADMLKDAYNIVQYEVKANNKEGGYEPSQNKKAYAAYKEGGVQGYLDFLGTKEAADKAGISVDKYTEKMNEGGTQAVEQYIADKNAKAEKKTEKDEIKSRVKSFNEIYGTELTTDQYQKYSDMGATASEISFMGKMKKETSNNEEVLDYLGKQNISDAQRSKYLMMNTNKKSLESKYVQRGLGEFGDSALYQIFNTKANADLDDNGSVTQKEAKEYVDSMYEDAEERDRWYYTLTGKDYSEGKSKSAKTLEREARKAELDNFNSNYGTEVTSRQYQKYSELGASDDEIAFISKMKDATSTNDEVLNYLGSQDISDEQRSRYLLINTSKSSLSSKYVQRGLSEFGESSLYQIFSAKANADLDNNGNTSQNEARSYVDYMYDDIVDRARWYYILTGKDY